MKVSRIFGFGGLLGIVLTPALSIAQNGMSVPALPNITPENVGKCIRLVPKKEVIREIPLNPIVTYEGHTEYRDITPQLVADKLSYVEVEGYTYEVPQFKKIVENVNVSPGYNRLVAIPGQMETKPVKVIVRPPSLVWKKGANLSSVSVKDPNSGDVYCLVEDRGIEKEFQVTKVIRPYGYKIETVAPVPQPITRLVVDKDAPKLVIPVKPVMNQIDVMRLANPDPAANSAEALVSQASIWKGGKQEPLNYQQIDVPAGYAWEFVDCNNVQYGAPISGGATKLVAPQPVEVKFPPTKTVVITKKQLQTRLQTLGLYSGPIDGVIGTKTKNALAEFQKQNSLPITGMADTKTLKALGF